MTAVLIGLAAVGVLVLVMVALVALACWLPARWLNTAVDWLAPPVRP